MNLDEVKIKTKIEFNELLHVSYIIVFKVFPNIVEVLKNRELCATSLLIGL